MPEEYWGEFDRYSVRSMGQLEARKADVLDHLQKQEVINSRGVWVGTGASVAANILDPVAYGIALGTEGAAAPFILGNKITRLGRAIRGGILASAGTAPVEAYIASQDVTYDAQDAVVSSLTAGLFGGVLSGRMTAQEKALEDMRRAMVAHEASQAGATVTPKGMAELGDLANPDGTLKTTEEVNKSFFKRNQGHATFASWARLDRAADNFSTESPKVAGLSAALFDDVAPAAGTLRGESASLWKSREHGRITRSYMKSSQDNLKAFREEQNAKWTQNFQSQREFNRQVTKALRGQQVESAAVKKHAAEVRRLYDEIAQMANNPGGKEGIKHAVRVKGAENMLVPDYVNRRWSAAALDDAILAAEQAHPKQGRLKVQERIAAAIGGGIDPKTAMEVADHLMQVVKKSKQGGLDMDSLHSQGQNLDLFLQKEHGMDPSDASAIANSIRRLAGGKDAGKDTNLKSRLNLDEEALEDLLENDIDTLFGSYSNSMLGHIALARQGIDSEDGFRRLLQEAQEELYAGASTGRMHDGKRKRAIRNIEEAYDFLVGRPIRDDPTSGFSTAGRILRKVNYSRLMNMVGLAQIAELGNALGHVGIKAFLVNVPELAKVRRRLKDGTFKDDMLEELADLTGGLADYRLLHRSAQRIEEFTDGNGLKEDLLSRVERGLDGLNHVTSDISGFNFINQQLHALTMKGMVQTFMDAARTGKHVLSRDRLRELGIDDELMKDVKRELMKASRDSKGKVKKLHLEKWDDATRVKFGNALRRWNNTIIQENDFGSLPGFMSHPAVKIIMQFKSFMLAAYGKQLLNNVKHRDRTAMMASLGGLAFGCLSYMAYVGATAPGREDKQQYLDKMLSLQAITTGAIQRAGWSSVLPGIIDTPSSFGVYDPLFNTRGTGLDSNWITGSATYDLFVNGFGGFGKETVEAIRDGEFTRNTAKSIVNLTPFQNALGLRNTYNLLYGELPDDPYFD